MKQKDGRTLAEYLREEQLVSRFVLLRVGLVGAFCGVILGLIFAFAGLV